MFLLCPCESIRYLTNNLLLYCCRPTAIFIKSVQRHAIIHWYFGACEINICNSLAYLDPKNFVVDLPGYLMRGDQINNCHWLLEILLVNCGCSGQKWSWRRLERQQLLSFMLLHMEIRLLLLKLSGWFVAVVKSIEHVKIFCNMHLTFLKILKCAW